MSYKFIDTFIKECTNDKCQKKRESIRCVDLSCEKVDLPNQHSKIEILENFNKDFNKQLGGSEPKDLKRIRLRNLRKKYEAKIISRKKQLLDRYNNDKSFENETSVSLEGAGENIELKRIRLMNLIKKYNLK